MFARVLGILLLALLCSALVVGAAEPVYSIQNWQTEDGLPQNSVNALVQTREGYLWLATFNGLVRFDGVRFTVFDTSHTPELVNSRVTSLFEDSRGRLWIGHETGDVTRNESGRFQPLPIGDAGARSAILSFGEDAQGKIWFLDANGLLVQAEDGLSFPPATAGGVNRRMIGLTRDREGKLWVLREDNLSVIERGRPATVGLKGAGANFVQAVCAGHTNGLWLLIEGRVRKWSAGDFGADQRLCPVPQRFVTTMMETANGTVVLGTQEQGLFLLPPAGAAMQFSRSNGLSDNWVRSVSEDREGNLWVGTGNGGLDVLRPGNVQEVAPPDHWQGRALLSVCAGRDGGLWVGTEGAGLYHFRENNWEHFSESSGLSNLFVWSVLEGKDGQLWAGTWGGGLLEKKAGRFAPVAGLDDLTTPITALFQDHQGVLWAGTGSGLLRLADGQPKWFGREKGVQLTDIRAIAEDRDGAIWCGTSGAGLWRLKDGTLQQFRKRDGLASDFIMSLHAGTDGVLWIGTFGGGLNRLKQDRFVTLGVKEGLPNNVVLSIEDDGRGNFWMSSHGGLFRVEKSELNACAEGRLAAVHGILYGKREGLPTLECSGGFQPVAGRTADSRMWFPTRKGLVAVSPDAVRTNASPPTVLLEEILVDGNPVAFPTNAAPLLIQPGQARLEFGYTGLFFTAPERVRFQYRLIGLERAWVEAGNRRSVPYNYLPPGSYTFHVTACNDDGVWNETGAGLTLTVLPHFWQTWTFRILTGVLAAAALSGLVLVAARRRLRQKLERLERQQAVERERARIAQDIHDDLGANLTRITMLSQSFQAETEPAEQRAAALDQIYQTARDLTRAMDEIVWAVNPRHDSLDSLATYLGKLAQDFLRPAGIRCRLELPMQLPPLPLTAEIRHNLFLAFKEALNNVVKHSGAVEVRVTLLLENGGFTLAVEDNGRGFAPEKLTAAANPDRAASGNGLANMRRRLEKIGGVFAITSAPGAGATVRFSLKNIPAH